MTRHHPRRPIRAMRAEEPDAVIAARVAALRPFLGSTREQRLAALSRLLRQERRAARNGVSYDASRHAALLRLAAEIEPSSSRKSDEPGTGRKEKGRHAKHSDLSNTFSNVRPRRR